MECESDYFEDDESSLRFEQAFQVLPFSKYKNPDLETGDKIIMSQSSLSRILTVGLIHPLTLQIESYNDQIISHCGVLEFDAQEGFIYMPAWMMKNMKLLEGHLVIIRDTWVPKGTYIRVQPHTTAFIEITNPKAVLEKALWSFTCLTSGDTFMVRDNEKEFYIRVLEVRPGRAICLVDTDCEVEFAEPLDQMEMEKVSDHGDKKEFRAFMGKGRRLDGEAVRVEIDKYCGIVEGLARLGIKDQKKDGGKEVGEIRFKAFTGRSYFLGVI